MSAEGDVRGAVDLAYYACGTEKEQFGVLVELAIELSARGSGIGTLLMRELPRWLDSEVPNVHVFADVCTLNARSERMLQSAGWRKVCATECNVWNGGKHDCDGEATRYCAHHSH